MASFFFISCSEYPLYPKSILETLGTQGGYTQQFNTMDSLACLYTGLANPCTGLSFGDEKASVYYITLATTSSSLVRSSQSGLMAAKRIGLDGIVDTFICPVSKVINI